MIFEHLYKGENLRFPSTYSTSQSDLFLTNSSESVGLEQDCLARLKKQREKIEQAAGKNEQLQKEVNRLKEEKQELIATIEDLRPLEIYREKYEALKVEFQRMLDSHQLAEYEIEELKIELEKAVDSSQQEADRLKAVIRQQKEANVMHIAHLEALIVEKDEKTQRLKKETEAQEENLTSKIEMLKEQNDRLRDCLMQQGIELEQSQEILKKQLRNKEIGLAGSEKCIQQLKKQIKSLKFEIEQLKFEHSKGVEQYKELIDQTRTGSKLIKREKETKQSQIAQLREEIKRYEGKCKVLESNVLTVKENMSKWKSKFELNQAKRGQTKLSDQQKLQQTVIRLRSQIQRHVQDYNLLAIELKRAKSIIQQKESHINRRKSLKKS